MFLSYVSQCVLGVTVCVGRHTSLDKNLFLYILRQEHVLIVCVTVCVGRHTSNLPYIHMDIEGTLDV